MASDVVAPDGGILVPKERVLAVTVIAGDPIPSPRLRVASRGGTFYPRDYLAKRDVIATMLKSSRTQAGATEAPVGLLVRFFRQTRRHVDLDNLLKTIMDAANGILWNDDVQVHEIVARKFHDPDWPRTEVVAYRLPSR